MVQRYTKKQLEEWQDYKLLFCLVGDRKRNCTNVYSPLYQRLTLLQNKLLESEPLTKTPGKRLTFVEGN